MSRLPALPGAPRARSEATSCGALLHELQELWNEIGENDAEKDRLILQLEQDCLNVYINKVEQTRKYKSDLHRALEQGKAEIEKLIISLGEQGSYPTKLVIRKGTLKEQHAMINPLLTELKKKKEARAKEFMDIQLQMIQLCTEMTGSNGCRDSVPTLNENDLSLNKLGELKSRLHELQKEKSIRLQKVSDHITTICDLCNVMTIDSCKTLSDIHPTLSNDTSGNPKDISDETISKLGSAMIALNKQKKQRHQKVKDLASTLIELWNLMDTPVDEQRRFDHVTNLILAAPDTISSQGCLSSDVIKEVDNEVQKLNLLKTSKLKELILKRQTELEEIYSGVHMDVDSSERLMLIENIDSGRVDLSKLLSGMESRIAKAKEEALNRKEILDRAEKWMVACAEESWLDEYEQDQNRYSAGRGAHKNLKRAEKARLLVNKMPALLESLVAKIKAWEQEKGVPFLYDKVRLLETLENYTLVRQHKEDEKRKLREQKKMQEQAAAEREALYGSKPSAPPFSAKKPLAQISHVNAVEGTPISRRISTPFAKRVAFSSGRKDTSLKKGSSTAPVMNFVSLAKDVSSAQSP